MGDASLLEGMAREDFDDAFNDIDQLLECHSDIFAIDNLAFAKRNENGVGVVRLEWTGLGVGIGHSRKHVAIFQRELGFRWFNWQRKLEGFRR